MKGPLPDHTSGWFAKEAPCFVTASLGLMMPAPGWYIHDRKLTSGFVNFTLTVYLSHRLIGVDEVEPAGDRECSVPFRAKPLQRGDNIARIHFTPLRQ